MKSWRWVGAWWGALLLVLMTGCASPPPAGVVRSVSAMRVAPADAPLARLAEASGVPAGQSGFWPYSRSSFALNARLMLIRQARDSLDLQSYLIGDDAIGHLMLAELRAAALRGVRVRVLVDDLYTGGMDPLLLALDATPGVQVRLFNPFFGGRDSSLARDLGFIGDFRRLNHRMHNKLFIADGSAAMVGGRNLADEYFFRSREANFIDMELLCVGALVPQLGTLFDRYWNSDTAYPVRSVVTPGPGDTPEVLARVFAERTRARDPRPPLDASELDDYGAPPPSAQLAANGRLQLVVAPAGAHADDPDKARPEAADLPQVRDTVTVRFVQLLQQARREVIVFSPYFIPGRKGIERLRQAREHGIEVRIVTNAKGTSDEPLVNLGYERYRDELLGMGLKLYEMSANRLPRDPLLKRALGSSRGRLHAKMAFVDRETVLVGSMNLDPRSAYINTEVGVAVRSPELARMILSVFRVDGYPGAYEVRLQPDGRGVQWVGHDDEGDEVLIDEPEVGAWDRLRLWFMSLFVSEDLL